MARALNRLPMCQCFLQVMTDNLHCPSAPKTVSMTRRRRSQDRSVIIVAHGEGAPEGMHTRLKLLSAVCGQFWLAPRSYTLQVALSLPAALRRDALLIAIIVAYWLCGRLVAHLADFPPKATITIYLATYVRITAIMIVLLIVGRGALIVMHDRPARPLTQLWREIRTSLVTPERVAHALPIVIGMPVFAATFTVVKKSIPIFAPFTWDVTFEKWDRWLHGGFAPWELIHPMLGSPGITYGINWAYNIWFYVLAVIWAYQAFSQRDDRLRQQFFLTLFLGWILLGNVAAMLFSSAGPCFFGDVTGLPDPFLPLMRYLNDANQVHPIWALEAQGALLQAYTMQGVSAGVGISAMPSMHVAIATLFALVCWRIQRWLGVAMTIFAMVIMIGSVHLGWHYAIDGYFGALGMIAIWWVVGRALDRQAQNAANRRTAQLV